jgi:hypothetical protein
MTSSVPSWVLVGLPVIGYLAAVGTEYMRGRQTLEREREPRRHERQTGRSDARDAFERDTLLELQDALAEFARNCGKIQHLDEMEYRESGVWGRQLLGDEVGGEGSLEYIRRIQRLRVRVLDDNIRARVREYIDHASASTIGAMRDEPAASARARSVSHWAAATDTYMPLFDAIGERLRQLFLRP